MVSLHVCRAQHALRFSTRRCIQSSRRWSSTVAPAQHDPLRVLFCGADEFSIHSLRALHALQERDTNIVASIDVVCRPDKHIGRGLKKVQEVPIKRVAQDLGLTIHQLDSFNDWSPPASINLVIAVSFGLLVPARVLEAARYGGLNVHPSLLPELRGAAPIQHTLLQRKTHTGVTVQTMHPTKFDHGTILAQTPSPGVVIPDECTPDRLLNLLGPLGMDMLCTTIEESHFVPPVQKIASGVSPERASYAPKIMPQDRKIDWSTWTAEDIVVKDRVMGGLWDDTTYQRCIHGPNGSAVARRTTFHGPWKKVSDSALSDAETQQVGCSVMYIQSGHKKRAVFTTTDGYILTPAAATIEGQRREQGLGTLQAGLGKPSRSDA